MKTVFKTIVFAILFLLPTSVFAYTVNTISDQHFDQSISDQTNTVYKTPNIIYISQVSTESSKLESNPSLWVKALYYYSITRLHFADIPYNYLVDSNGQIYEGRAGGVGANPELENQTGSVLIGYLSNNPILSNRAATSIYTLADDLATKYGIPNYSVVDLKIIQKEGQLSKLQVAESSGDFKQSVADAFSGWKGYSSETLSYNAKIEEVTYEKEVEIGSKLHVSVKVTNKDDFTWLTDKFPIYISTADGKDSGLAINGVWDSFSKPTHIENKAVKPGESVTLEFDLYARTAPGEVAQNFVLEKNATNVFKDSSFEVKFNVVKGTKTLVQVSSSEYGFANIRTCQWYSCEIIDSVDNGVVFVLLSEENGWMKIQYTESSVGWVFSRYMKKI